MMTAEFLADEGLEVTQARDGDEAACLLDAGARFDILFTDVQMPGVLDGIDLALHARRRCPAIPLLVVSGYAARLATRLGTFDPPAVLVGKPYDLGTIADALRRLAART